VAKKKEKAEPSGAEGGSAEELGILTGNKVKGHKIEFAWPGMILRHALNLIDGVKGTGKSSLIAHIAATICGGVKLPESKTAGPKGSCLWFGSEEDFGGSVVQRWKVNGGNVCNIHTVSASASDGPGRLMLPCQEERLRSIVRIVDAKVIVCDPFSSLAESAFDTRHEQSTRLYLESLSRIAHEERVTVLLARHLKKSRSGSVLDQGLGSVAIAATCRSVLRVERSQQDENVCYFACVAGNHGRASGVVPYTLTEMPGYVFTAQFKKRQDVNLEEVIEGDEELEEPTAMDDCLTLLRNALKGGPVDARVILDEASKNGMGLRTLRKAQKKLGVKTKRSGGGKGVPGKWVWYIPAKS
jgi:hypothetical protein